MAKQSLSGQLDLAIATVLSQRNSTLPVADRALRPLLSVASVLRDLPREDFKLRLKQELQRRTSMASKPVPSGEAKPKIDPIRTGFRSLTPYPVVQDVPALLDFMKQTFLAEELFRAIGSAGGFHCEVRVGDSMMMIGGGGAGAAWRGDSRPMALHIYVGDTDAAYKRALAAGATSLSEPAEMPYGERSAGVKDPSGNVWYIATISGKTYHADAPPAVIPYLHPLRAEPVISFLKHAFGAVEQGKFASPDGVVHHAILKIGSSAIEMGEAHDQYQPMPSMFYLYVADADAVYKSALEAGAISVTPPATQPYGDRVGAVKDVFGNEWYIATCVSDASV
jgi:PhnB protein